MRPNLASTVVRGGGVGVRISHNIVHSSKKNLPGSKQIRWVAPPVLNIRVLQYGKVIECKLMQNCHSPLCVVQRNSCHAMKYLQCNEIFVVQWNICHAWPAIRVEMTVVQGRLNLRATLSSVIHGTNSPPTSPRRNRNLRISKSLMKTHEITLTCRD